MSKPQESIAGLKERLKGLRLMLFFVVTVGACGYAAVSMSKRALGDHPETALLSRSLAAYLTLVLAGLLNEKVYGSKFIRNSLEAIMVILSVVLMVYAGSRIISFFM